MKQILMSELADQIRGVSYKPDDLHDALDNESVVLLRANNIDDGRINFEDIVFVDRKKVSEIQFLQKGDILICASSGSKNLVGKAAQVDFDGEFTFGAFCKVVRPTHIEADYLGMYFQSNMYRKLISSLAQGANINNIKNDHIDNLLVNVADATKQQYVVSTLGAVNTVIQKRKAELQKLDELVKARFVELFEGHSWDVVRAESIMCDMRNGVSPSTKGKHREKVLTLSAITQGDFDAAAWKDGLFEDSPPPEKRIRTSDFYMCRGNGNKTLVGTGVYSTADYPDLIFPDTVIAARIDEQKVCMPFLGVAWKRQFVRSQIEAAARTTNGTYKINQGIISNIEIMLPPLSLQRQFAAFVAQVDKSKLVVQKGLEKLEILKKSLMQQYFG
jgi:type I restriction enzyme S subunit